MVVEAIQPCSLDWLNELRGWSGPDPYSTAWVALVPHKDDLHRPAWPETLDYLRYHQLEDGGWGAPGIYYAHERLISTMAAIHALHTWQSNPADTGRIQRGLEALQVYTDDLLNELIEPIGFELITPRLRDLLLPAFGDKLPLDKWAAIDELNGEKLALIQRRQPDPDAPRAWWFSMEMLPQEQLACLDDSVLDEKGTIAAATAATAAYLAARRYAGADSPCASSYLAQLLAWGGSGVPFCWPFDVFENVWVLDNFRRAGLDPRTPAIARLVKIVHNSWELNQPGLSYSDLFRVNDGDDTMVGFTVLNWAGVSPSDEPVLAFWDEDHFRSYMDERSPSVSANIHALTALRTQDGFPHRNLARRLTEWLAQQMNPTCLFDDKWHYSPYYSVAHAISAFAGWDDTIARQCIDHLLEHQQPDGGWGGFGFSTQEETAHCMLALYNARAWGLLRDRRPLAAAARFFQSVAYQEPEERLWIGKTLFRPEGIVKAVLLAAHVVLERLGYSIRIDDREKAA